MALEPSTELFDVMMSKAGFNTDHDNDRTKVFTGDLDPNVTGKHLHQVFRQYGQLVHAKIHAGKQCGFVQLARRCDEEALRIPWKGLLFLEKWIFLFGEPSPPTVDTPRRLKVLHRVSDEHVGPSNVATQVGQKDNSDAILAVANIIVLRSKEVEEEKWWWWCGCGVVAVVVVLWFWCCGGGAAFVVVWCSCCCGFAAAVVVCCGGGDAVVDDPSLAENTDVVPFTYHLNGHYIQFEKEEFCLITGLRFGVEFSERYLEGLNPFRRLLFNSHIDGSHITCQMLLDEFNGEEFYKLQDEDVVVVCEEVMFMGSRATDEYISFHNVNTNKVAHGDYVDCMTFPGSPEPIYLDFHVRGFTVEEQFWRGLMELMIRARPHDARYTMAKTGTASMHPGSHKFVIETDEHIISMLDGSSHPYPSWDDIDIVYMPINSEGNHWVTGVINLPKSIIHVIDSLHSLDRYPLQYDQISKWTKVLNSLLEKSSHFERTRWLPYNFELVYNQGLPFEIPQQANLSDCRVVTCWVIENLCMGHAGHPNNFLVPLELIW
ncbi:phospholipase-like protein [Tanacetum coccineum]